MRVSFCFTAGLIAQAMAVPGQAAPAEARRVPPPEQSSAAPAPIDAAHILKRVLVVGNRMILVDQVIDEDDAATPRDRLG